MFKKILIVILLILVMAFIGWFIVIQKAGPQEGKGGVDDSEKSFFDRFFPFGDSSDIDEDRGPSPTKTKDSEGLFSGSDDGLKLQQLTNTSIVGFIATTTKSSLFVRYMDRSVGNIYDINIKTLEKNRVTNTTIPAVNNMLWHKNAEDYILRYADENNILKTYIGSIIDDSTATSSSLAELSGDFIKDNIIDVISDQSRENTLYLLRSGVGSRGITQKFGGDVASGDVLFQSPFLEWRLSWQDNLITATTKPSYISNGYLYFIDEKTGVFVKILGNIIGLTTITNTSGEKIIYSGYIDDIFSTLIHNSINDVNDETPFKTLPEKCAWDTNNSHIIYCGVPTGELDNTLPDSWYQGVTQFSDNIWMLDVDQNTAHILSEPEILVGAQIDIVDPIVTDDGKYFLFKNKKDSTLWSLELGEIVEVEEEESSEEVEEG